MEKDSQEQSNISKPWLYKKGQSGNPGGRPKGSKSLKQWVKERLETMTDEEREAFLEGIPKNILWEMGEGKPHSQSDITTGGKPIPLLNYVIRDNNSDNKDTTIDQENKDNPGGDISQ